MKRDEISLNKIYERINRFVMILIELPKQLLFAPYYQEFKISHRNHITKILKYGEAICNAINMPAYSVFSSHPAT